MYLFSLQKYEFDFLILMILLWKENYLKLCEIIKIIKIIVPISFAQFYVKIIFKIKEH